MIPKICPRCKLKDDVNAKFIVSNWLVRCERCGTDYNVPTDSKKPTEKPLKGMRRILNL